MSGRFWLAAIWCFLALGQAGGVAHARSAKVGHPGLTRAVGAIAAARMHRAWRPKWWPALMAAGTGQAGIVIKLSRQRVYFHDGRRIWKSFPCSTGLKRRTPAGFYRIVTKQQDPDWLYKDQFVPGGEPENPLGVCWLGLGMPRSWRGAPIGMHGTNAPWFIGQPASHGCIRMFNEDAWLLYRKAPLGTLVYITP